ncbi:hypothetical protein [Haloarchaeobius iranensis]|uniref:Uncharacterized protein n=1 Tax=Haloarchaeobius iranensis TaxID=996166 RepID=A0A1G9Z7P6_9EURY|nr:hypothetical protein [Haloarchaeobius iranensis]SDN16586.1 hypothetical protein SAMN05192554_11828 [Haloarchaeobius iranensis]
MLVVSTTGCLTQTIEQRRCGTRQVGGDADIFRITDMNVSGGAIQAAVDVRNGTDDTTLVLRSNGSTETRATPNADGSYELVWERATPDEWTVTFEFHLRNEDGDVVETARYRLACRHRTGTGTVPPASSRSTAADRR